MVEITRFAREQTLRRLVASLINEQYIAAVLDGSRVDGRSVLRLVEFGRERANVQHIQSTWHIILKRHPSLGRQVKFIAPDDVDFEGAVPDAADLFESLYSIFPAQFRSDKKAHVIQELRIATDMQEQWFRLYPAYLPNLNDSLVAWERAIIRGHPVHPMHKTCLAAPPLPPIMAQDLPGMLSPEVSCISIPRTEVLVVGPLEKTIRPLLQDIGAFIDNAMLDTHILLPCLSQQVPAILHHFPKATVQSSGHADFEAQASMRTVSVHANVQSNFPYHIKFALACEITSALRTISPWTACIGPETTALLEQVLPPQIWLFREIAAVTGSQKDFSVAKHISLLIREDVSLRAQSQGQIVVPAAALFETTVTAGPCHAESTLNLDTMDKRYKWFETYTHELLSLVLPLAYKHGVALEGHGQNICVRLSKTDGALKGFAYRDYGGMKLHMPTLRAQGYDITSSPPGSLVLIDDIHECWDLIWHTIFGSHLTQMITALGFTERLETEDRAWSFAAGEVRRILRDDTSGAALGLQNGLDGSVHKRPNGNSNDPDTRSEAGRKASLRSFLLADTVPYKCFLRMKMEGLYRDYLHIQVPNPLLKHSSSNGCLGNGETNGMSKN